MKCWNIENLSTQLFPKNFIANVLHLTGIRKMYSLYVYNHYRWKLLANNLKINNIINQFIFLYFLLSGKLWNFKRFLSRQQNWKIFDDAFKCSKRNLFPFFLGKEKIAYSMRNLWKTLKKQQDLIFAIGKSFRIHFSQIKKFNFI